MSKLEKAYSFNEIGLVPRVVSTLQHRSEADTSVSVFGVTLNIPLVATPMPDVCNGRMAGTLAILGAMGVIHRFQTIDEQVNEYKLAKQLLFGYYDNCNISEKDNFSCAIGATGDYIERFNRLYSTGCRIFVIDTANGANTQVSKAIKALRNCNYSDVYLIAGAVATREGYKYLAEEGVDGVRVGISGGSACITRTETGVYYPMVSSIMECYDESCKLHNPPVLISDGGISIPADMAKALTLGADIIFAGSMFAGTKESPGSVLKNKEGNLFKIYRGAASFGVQAEYSNAEPAYNEGAETFVPYKSGGVEGVINRFSAGLRSSMSYMNARTLKEFRQNVNFVIL